MDDDAILAHVRKRADHSRGAPHPSGSFTLWSARVPTEHLEAVEDWVARNGGHFVPAAEVSRQTQIAADGVPDDVTPAHWVIPLAAIGAD